MIYDEIHDRDDRPERQGEVRHEAAAVTDAERVSPESACNTETDTGRMMETLPRETGDQLDSADQEKIPRETGDQLDSANEYHPQSESAYHQQNLVNVTQWEVHQT